MRDRSQSSDFTATFFIAVAVATIVVVLLLGMIYGCVRASQRGSIKQGARVEPVQIEHYTPPMVKIS
jgi:hypothetical protein